MLLLSKSLGLIPAFLLTLHSTLMFKKSFQFHSERFLKNKSAAQILIYEKSEKFRKQNESLTLGTEL